MIRKTYRSITICPFSVHYSKGFGGRRMSVILSGHQFRDLRGSITNFVNKIERPVIIRDVVLHLFPIMELFLVREVSFVQGLNYLNIIQKHAWQLSGKILPILN